MSTFGSMEELNQIFLDKNSEIVSFVNKNDEEVILDGIPGKTQLVKWRCANEREHVSKTMLSKILEKEHHLCLNCGRRAYKTVHDLIDHFESKGSKILAILDENEEEVPVTFVPEGSTKIRWTCAENEAHIETSPLKNVTAGNRERYICRTCSSSKGRGGPTYESFSKDLEQRGWSMISDKSEYKNTKSLMNVTCDQGHEFQTSQNRFSTNHGCSKCVNGSKKLHIEDVAVAFEKKGFQLTSTEYVDNKTPLSYICKCGRENEMSYVNLVKNKDGCKRCTRRWTLDEVGDFFEEAACDMVDIDTEEFVLNSTGIYYICVCGMEHFSSWRLFKNGARCPGCTVKRIKETCMKKYGVDNPSKSLEIKKKIVETMRERYDVDYATQVVEFMDRNKQTNLDNHGGVHNLATPELRKLSVDAYTKKYGDKFGRVKIHQDKATAACKQKYGTKRYIGSDHYKKRMMMDHGQEYFANSSSFYSVMMDRYGVKHAMQNPELFDKMVKSSFTLKEYIMPSGDVRLVQGYEPYALRDLLVKDIDGRFLTEDDVKTGAKNVPCIDYYTLDGKYHVYHPDMYIPSLNLIIEVKSTYTLLLDYEKNLAKFSETFASGYDFEVWVYDGKGVRMDKIEYASDLLSFED